MPEGVGGHFATHRVRAAGGGFEQDPIARAGDDRSWAVAYLGLGLFGVGGEVG